MPANDPDPDADLVDLVDRQRALAGPDHWAAWNGNERRGPLRLSPDAWQRWLELDLVVRVDLVELLSTKAK